MIQAIQVLRFHLLELEKVSHSEFRFRLFELIWNFTIRILISCDFN